MKKILLILSLIIVFMQLVNGQNCTTSFTYSAMDNIVVYTNTSNVANAHFYWNFGDGASSNSLSPTHTFPDDGEYLVTLYGKDTITNCVDVFDTWIIITKPDTIVCDLLFTDTIKNISGDDFLFLTDLTYNCNGYYVNCDAGPSINGACSNNGNLLLGWGSALFFGRQQAYTYDTINGSIVYKEYYRTIPYNYSSETNYQNCSANFEFIVDYQPSGALLQFSAMNRNATSYQWEIMGFGNPIYSTSPSISQLYPYVNYEEYFPWLVMLRVTDTVNNCEDTVTQQILIKNPNYTIPSDIKENKQSKFSIFPNPTTDFVNIDMEESINLKYKLTIIDMFGKQVYGNLLFDRQSKIDVSNLSRGVYIMEIRFTDWVSRRKFIKK